MLVHSTLRAGRHLHPKNQIYKVSHMPSISDTGYPIYADHCRSKCYLAPCILNRYRCVRPGMSSTPSNASTANSMTGKGSGNNYAYLVVDDKSKDAAIIDPANPPEYAPIDYLDS